MSQGTRLDRNKRGSLIRPHLNEILDYRKSVDDAMVHFLGSRELSKEELYFVELGLNHEQQHQELLVTDIKYIFSTNPLLPAVENQAIQENKTLKESFNSISEGIYEIGHTGNAFSFDNEKPRHKVYLQSFEVRNQLITCGQYLEFINDGAYSKAELWLSEGWDWVLKNKINAPEYWFIDNDTWKQYTWYGIKNVDENAPVTHISYYEAEAFARWYGMRLLTEFEWEVAAHQLDHLDSGLFLEDHLFQPLHLKEISMFGNTWEWCNSAYLPYPNYVQAEGALGEYNGKFMINQMVLRGGSCATAQDHFRLTYRNFFHPHLRWQFTGIRLARKSIV